MAKLFDATKQNISPRLKNIFADGELDWDSVVKESLTTATDGKRYKTLLYNLDAILAVGYQGRSPLPYKPQRGGIHTARGNAPGQTRRKGDINRIETVIYATIPIQYPAPPKYSPQKIGSH